MKALKALIAALVLVYPANSQSQRVPISISCGASSDSTAVYLDSSPHPIAQPGPGKAVIYFIQDVDQPVILPYPVVSIGIDGRWVGANENDSYFAVTVEPGWHDLCAAGDPEFDHLVAEPGGVYFFHIKIFVAEDGVEFASLAPLRSDDASLLIASYPLAMASFGSLNESWPNAIRNRPATGQGQQLLLQARLASGNDKAEPARRRPAEDHAPRTRHDSDEHQPHHDPAEHQSHQNSGGQHTQSHDSSDHSTGKDGNQKPTK